MVLPKLFKNDIEEAAEVIEMERQEEKNNNHKKNSTAGMAILVVVVNVQ
jgi:hypothetical protein